MSDNQNLRQAALAYHVFPKPGKLEIRATKPMANGRDLARAYSDMGDPVGARSILEEVIEEGGADQKIEAESLISKLA